MRVATVAFAGMAIAGLAIYAREHAQELNFLHCLGIAAALAGVAEMLSAAFDAAPEDPT